LDDHDLDAELAAPAFLEGFGDALVGLLRDGEEFDFQGNPCRPGNRRRRASWRARSGSVARAGGWEIAGDAGGVRPVAGICPPREDVFDDGLTVDGEGEGLADAGIAEDCGGDVETEKVAVEDGLNAEEGGAVFFVGVDFAKRDVQVV